VQSPKEVADANGSANGSAHGSANGSSHAADGVTVDAPDATA
jgi:hypothetical protein